ncbi:MAG TPA: hypothetical protein VMT11_21700 [Myxococcaceae bacterium]|nr:hypothetical protein [Myxococcaceae bacterium]
MRWNVLAVSLVLAAATAGCNSVKTWNCAYSCTTPQASGTKAYQDDDEPEAEDKCTTDFGGSKCTAGFTCDCTQG